MNNLSDISGIALQELNDLSEGSSQNQLQPQSHQLNGVSHQFNHDPPYQQLDKIDADIDQRRGQGEPSIFNLSNQDKQNIASDATAQSKPSSIVSRGSSEDSKQVKEGQKSFRTPTIEKRFDAKFSTFENSELFSGARENHYTSNNSTNEKKVIHAHSDADMLQYHNNLLNQPLSDQKMTDDIELNLQDNILSPDFNPNHSTQKDSSQRMQRERERRSCRDKTSKYSLTHKGMCTNICMNITRFNQIAPLETSDEHPQKSHSTFARRGYQGGPDNSYDHNHIEGQDESGLQRDANKEGKPHKKSVPKSAEQCLNSIRDMLSFDWTLKDIANLRHSPQEQKEAQPNNQSEQELSSAQEQVAPLETFEKNEADIAHSVQEHIPSFIQTLFREKRFQKFKKQFKELHERALQEPLNEVEILNIEKIQNPEQNGQITLEAETNTEMKEEVDVLASETIKLEDEIAQQTEKKFMVIFDLLNREIEYVEKQNRDQLYGIAQKMKDAYDKALNAKDEEIRDTFVYRPDDMDQYGLEFVSRIEPLFVQDFQQNAEWYKENFNEILVNFGHPSKLEKDFLKHIEFVQQKKSDIKYKKILKQLEQGKRSDQINLQDDDKYLNLNNTKRNLVAQEDAQCAICNNGDYEDEDMIVFCGNCNVPVHQSCYGIEQLPEGDWICYNCEIFGMKRGLMVNCMLCPKKGGAMKPTNIFTSFENYKKYNSSNSHSKKSHKKNTQLQHSVSEKFSLVDSFNLDKKLYLGENEDKNLSLAVILSREFDYQSDLRLKYEKLDIPLDTLELIFDQNEKEIQTPEDYSFFLSKNEIKLESHAHTSTLYQWVHLSCASWIPGPLVTPKTPVRLNRFDEKRFNLNCIICLKKEGACMQCQASRCFISFHVECARRNNYCMEIERKDRDKTYRMFCEKHRPLKIVKEMEERDKQTIEEIQKFCKIIDKCVEIDYRHQLKPQKQIEKEKENVKQNQKQVQKQLKERSRKEGHGEKKEREKLKKWREKDKKMLFERVKEKYLLFRKMRINVIRVDPLKKLRKASKQQPRKRSKKRLNKKQSHVGGCRAGLRSKHSNNEEERQDLLQIQSQIEELEEEKQEDDIQDSTLHQDNIDGVDNTINPEEQDIYFKLSIPTYPTEMDWTITLSRNDFPWAEIKFNNFTAKDCYEKYSSIVKDAHTFLKKVLGLKEKYKKMMQNQLALAMQAQNQIPQAIGAAGTNAQEAQLYCKCKGTIISELYVKCDGDDECANGGWVHPQCTEQLKDKSKEELDAIEEWYCDDCLQRIKKEDEEELHEENQEENEGQYYQDDCNLSQDDDQLQINQEEDMEMQDQSNFNNDQYIEGYQHEYNDNDDIKERNSENQNNEGSENRNRSRKSSSSSQTSHVSSSSSDAF